MPRPKNTRAHLTNPCSVEKYETKITPTVTTDTTKSDFISYWARDTARITEIDPSKTATKALR